MTTGRSAASRSWAAYSAAAAAFSFALVSLYWAAGGMAALGTIGGAMEASARARDPTVVAATWAAFVLKVLGGLLALALVQPWGRRIPRRALLVAAVGGAAVLMLYGIANTVGVALISMDVLDNPAGLSRGAMRWRMLLWEPWFLVWGLFLGLAAWRFIRPRPPR